MIARSECKTVATFIAGNGVQLSSAFLDGVAPLVEKTGCPSITIEWLRKGVAADIFCHGASVDKLRATFAGISQAHPVDILVQSTLARRKKLLVADM
jgi:hypothetical protein